jgi:ADP-ribose pyrophosphatase YjhB (NUDIX family)
MERESSVRSRESKLTVMTRTDYLNDPSAPKANSVVPAVSAIVTDAQGAILLILRTDNGYWSIPGGGLNPGESVAQATTREVKEETGIDCEVAGLVGVYSDPNHVAAYDDGEVRQEFSICFTTRMTGGSLTASSESAQVEFVPAGAIPGLRMHPSIRLRIQHYLEKRAEPYIG